MTKKMKSYRLDELCVDQLEYLQKVYNCSQADIIQYLVNLLFMVQDNDCVNFDFTSFKKFMDYTFKSLQ